MARTLVRPQVATPQLADQDLFNVLLVDDHDLFATALSSLLLARGFASEVVVATTADDALRRADGPDYDLVLCDLDLPDLSGLELLRAFKETHPTVKVCMLSGSTSLQDIDRALELGADGYLLKTALIDEFLGALRSVMAGRLALDPQTSQAVLTRRSEHSAQTTLTVRQLEVLEMVAAGWSTNQIADELDLAIDTVRNTLRRVRQNLEVSSSVEAVVKGFRLGLLH